MADFARTAAGEVAKWSDDQFRWKRTHHPIKRAVEISTLFSIAMSTRFKDDGLKRALDAVKEIGVSITIYYTRR
jgi:hypothetical protein